MVRKGLGVGLVIFRTQGRVEGEAKDRGLTSPSGPTRTAPTQKAVGTGTDCFAW